MKSPLKISMKEFLQTGMFGPVRLGMSRAEVIEHLGFPDRVDMGFLALGKDNIPINWHYGNLKFFFDYGEDRLSSIYCFRDILPYGGRGIDLDPWIINRHISFKEIVEELKLSRIDYYETTSSDNNRDNYIELLVGHPQVKFRFFYQELCRVVWEEQKRTTPTTQETAFPLDSLDFITTSISWFKIEELGSWQEVRLTGREKALIPVYLEKWRAIALKTGPIDRKEAFATIQEIYELIGEEKPEIIFFNSPDTA